MKPPPGSDIPDLLMAGADRRFGDWLAVLHTCGDPETDTPMQELFRGVSASFASTPFGDGSLGSILDVVRTIEGDVAPTIAALMGVFACFTMVREPQVTDIGGVPIPLKVS